MNYHQRINFLGNQNDQLQIIKQLKSRLSEQLVIPDKILCRQQQIKEISKFLSENLDFQAQKQQNQKVDSVQNLKNKILYIQGEPGTGKTYCLKNIIQSYKQIKNKESPVIFVQVNAMKLSYSFQIYDQIFQQIFQQITQKPNSPLDLIREIRKDLIYNHQAAKNNLKSLVRCLKALTKIFIIIDEVDMLCPITKSQFLESIIFDWTKVKSVSFSLILISKIVNINDSFSKKLAQVFFKNKLIFPLYTYSELVQILKQRLNQFSGEGSLPFVTQLVEQISDQSASDIRKFLGRGREILRMHLRRKTLTSDQYRQISQSKQNIQDSSKQSIKRMISEQKFGESNQDSFSLYFPSFPLPYRQFLVAFAAYLQSKNKLWYPVIEIGQLFMVISSKISIKNEKFFREILHDLQDLNLIKIQYQFKKIQTNRRFTQLGQSLQRRLNSHIRLINGPENNQNYKIFKTTGRRVEQEHVRLLRPAEQVLEAHQNYSKLCISSEQKCLSQSQNFDELKKPSTVSSNHEKEIKLQKSINSNSLKRPSVVSSDQDKREQKKAQKILQPTIRRGLRKEFNAFKLLQQY